MTRHQARGLRDAARRTAADLIARGITDRARLRDEVQAEVLRWVDAEPTDDDERRARLACIGYGVADALGVDVGPDPAEDLEAPAWSREAT